MGVRSPWAAWQVDAATAMWGRWVEAKLQERDSKGRARWEVDRLLGPWPERGPGSIAPASELVGRYERTGGRR